MRRSAAISVLATLALFAGPARGATTPQSIEHGGLTRTYLVHLPAGYDGKTALPLVLVLHGGGGDGAGTARLTGFSDVADREGFIVAYPDGVDRNWRDGREVVGQPEVDDVGFLSALVEHLGRTYAVDPRRIYATGISNGALMSYTLACERAALFAAVGPVAGSMPEPLGPRCRPARPISIVQIHGTEDRFVPWDGGFVIGGRRGRVLSVPDTIALWAGLDGCPTAPRTVQEPDRDRGDGTRVRRTGWGPCRDGTEVALYTVEGGGHTWPGGLQYLPVWIVGRTSRDLVASAAIWAFFAAHTKR